MNQSPIENVPCAPAWYCLLAQPKHEHIAAASLKTVEGVETFCPRIRYRKATRRGPVWFVEAMFPGYLFAQFDYAAAYRAVLYARGVSTIVHFGARVPKLDQGAITALRERCADPSGGITVIDPTLEAGDNVTIATGAFSGLEAAITRIMSARERICVLIDFLGRQVEAQLSRNDVVLAKHPLSL